MLPSLAPPARRAGFTLIELLVVVAIIAILAAILLPALMGARTRGKMATCTSRQKQLYMAVAMYGDDSDGQVPNQGMALGSFGTSGYGNTYWSNARFHSERELQNDENSGAIAPIPADYASRRYYALGKLWPGKYLGDGQMLYCTDYEPTRLTNATTIVQARTAYRATGSTVSFVMDDGTYRLSGASMGRFHPTTYYVGAWVLNSGGVPSSIATTFDDGRYFERRKVGTPLFIDGSFEGDNGAWLPTIPHNNLGLVRMGNDGHTDFLANPLAGFRLPFGWIASQHPWSAGGIGGVPGLNPIAINKM